MVKTEYKSPNGMFQIRVGTGWIDFDHFSNQEPYVVYSKILVMDFKSMLLTKEMY